MSLFTRSILALFLIANIGIGTANAGLFKDAERAAEIDLAAHVIKDAAENPSLRERIGIGVRKVITIAKEKYPESAKHIEDAQHNGYPSELTIDRAGASARRAASLSGKGKIPGQDLDEYPPALFKEGGKGSSVRPISSSDNRGSGACIGNGCRSLSDGDKVKISVK